MTTRRLCFFCYFSLSTTVRGGGVQLGLGLNSTHMGRPDCNWNLEWVAWISGLNMYTFTSTLFFYIVFLRTNHGS